MKHKIVFPLLLACALTLGALLSGCSSESDEPKPLLQSFTATTLDGGSFTQADLEDKDLTIMNFWGTFCTPCVDEMPDLATFAQALPDNVAMVTVCLDGYGNEDSVQEILDNATIEANNVRAAAMQYMDDMLAHLENIITSATQSARSGYENFTLSMNQYRDIIQSNRNELHPAEDYGDVEFRNIEDADE